MIFPLFQPAVASGLPGTPPIMDVTKFFVRPVASVPAISNILSRVPTGWTYNPLGYNASTNGLQGNGFNGSNV